jgi:hypothetical protein
MYVYVCVRVRVYMLKDGTIKCDTHLSYAELLQVLINSYNRAY